MIKSFKHKGLKRFFIYNDHSLLNSNYCERISRVLDRLDSAEAIKDMNLPGYKLHKLLGDKKDIWSVSVSGNWRVTFQFELGHAYDVNFEDYH